MCMIEDSDPWDFSHHEKRTARKEHTCSECRRTIQPRETYQRTVGKMDGRIDTFTTCAHCMVASRWLSEICGGWLLNGLLEDLEEHWDEELELRHVWLGRAILSIRQKWQRRDGNLMPIPTLKLPPEYLASKTAAA